MKDPLLKGNLEHCGSENTSGAKEKASISPPPSSNKHTPLNESNRRAKEAIAGELEKLGFSKEAIADLLNMDW